MLANLDLEELAKSLGATVGDNSLIFPPRRCRGRGYGEACYVYFIGSRQFAAHRLHGEWFERSPEIEAEIERLNSHAQ